MADYKDYIVRYNIVANINDAVSQLEGLARIATEIAGPLEKVSAHIGSLSNSLKLLKENSKFTFQPTIDTKPFKAKLDTMLADVRTTAAQMSTAISNALGANPLKKQLVSSGAAQALSPKEIKKQLEKQLTEQKNIYDKIMGTPRIGKNNKIRRDKGELYFAKKAGKADKVEELKQQAATAKAYMREAQSSLKVLSQNEEKIQKQAEKTSKSNAARYTNVTPSTIKAWKEAFGNAKVRSLTVKIHGDASGPKGALSVINVVKEQLNTLKGVGTFAITPTLNTEAFAAAEQQLRRLAALTARITAPFVTQEGNKQALKPGKSGRLTKQESTALANAKQQMNILNKELNKAQQKLDENKAKYAANPNRWTKAAITKSQKALSSVQTQLAPHQETIDKYEKKLSQGILTAGQKLKPLGVDVVGSMKNLKLTGKTFSLPVDVKISSAQVRAAVSGIARPSLPVNIKLMWEKGAVGKQEQLKKLQTNVPPIKLKLNIDEAIAALNRFLEKIRTTPPQSIKLTATGTVSNNTASQTPSGIVPLPTTGGGSNQTTTPGQGTQGNQPLKTPKSSAPKGFVGSGSNRVFFGNTKPSESLAPKGYRWVRNTNLASKLTGSQANSYANALEAQNKAFKNLVDIRNSTQSAVEQYKAGSPMTNRYTRLTSLQNRLQREYNLSQGKLSNAQNQLLAVSSLQKQMEQLEAQKRTLQALPKLNKVQQKALQRINEAQPKIQEQINRVQNSAAGVVARETAYQPLLQARLNSVNSAMTAEKERVKQEGRAAMTQRSDARKAYQEARANTQKYTRGYSLENTTPKQTKTQRAKSSAKVNYSTPKQLQEQARLATQWRNAMMPFVSNQSQLNMLTQHRRFFTRAAREIGSVPTNATPAQTVPYLQHVANLMKEKNVAVPMQLQKEIQRLQKSASAGNGAGGGGRGSVVSSQTPIPFYDKARRWAYPFAGNTSFGARTPMAVDMAKGMGVMFAIGGAMSTIGNSFSQAMEYQNTMETTRAILQHGTKSYSNDNFQNMERIVREVGVKTKFSAPEVASAARFLAMAGFNIEQINSAIRPIADLALIGDYDLGETADKMTNIMTTFGADKKMKENPRIMREYANIMATVATRSNTDVMMLAESAKYGGGVAHMFGKDDPNIFADTMALFGVMGNAGIQGSSAGTAVRMMYMNLFNPNKKQKGILDMLESQYNVRFRDQNGKRRSMADILIDMANKIPENEMADIISKLFRITAQPGANAAIQSAVNTNAATLLGLANEDGSNVQEAFDAYEKLTGGLGSKQGISTLVALMEAARSSAPGNISSTIAEQKQNTIQGLWAQVTSTFTEGIVKAFGERQGGFADMLKSLRDYLAKPETVQMLRNLLDLIVEIGKVMAKFVKIWANLYSFMPGVIKDWVVIQMAFTQFGALISPLIQLSAVFNRLGISLSRLTGISLASSIRMRSAASINAASSSATLASASAVPFVIGRNRFKRPIKLKGKHAEKANMTAYGGANLTDALLVGSMLMPYPMAGNKTVQFSPYSNQTDRVLASRTHVDNVKNHYMEVRKRANRIYGWGRFRNGFVRTANWGLTAASLTTLFGGLKGLLFSLVGSLGSILGILFNPITIVTAALGGMAYALYKSKQYINGNTEAQIAARERATVAAQKTRNELTQSAQLYHETVKKYTPDYPEIVIQSSNDDPVLQKQREERQKVLDQFATIYNPLVQDVSWQAIDLTRDNWSNIIQANPHYQWALGDNWRKDLQLKLPEKYKYKSMNTLDQFRYYGVLATEKKMKAQDEMEYGAEQLQNSMAVQSIGMMAANSNELMEAIGKIHETINKYDRDFDNEDYQKEIADIITKTSKLGSDLIDASDWTPEYLQNNLYQVTGTQQYRQALYNILEHYASGGDGSPIASMMALHNLQDANSKIERYSEDWYNAIATLANEFTVTYKILDEKTQELKNLKFNVTTKDGLIDFKNLHAQIKQMGLDLKLTIQDFANICGNIYKELAEIAGIDITDKKARQGWLENQLQFVSLSYNSVEQWYDKHIATNPNHPLFKKPKNLVVNDLVNAERWENLGGGGNNKTLGLLSGPRPMDMESLKYYKVARQEILEDVDKTVFGENPEPINNKVIDTNKDPKTPQRTTGLNQDAYASKYEKGAAKPTYVAININNLANFDKTMIASSADERDLMANMESKIANAVYQIFAEASNQAQMTFNA